MSEQTNALPGVIVPPTAFEGEQAERPLAHWIAPVLVALIGAFMSLLDSSIVNVAIPTIMSVFNVGTSDVQWVSTIYMLALGVVVPFSGWLGDRLGFKRLYILSMGAFVAGSLFCSLSWNLNSLVVARVIQAVGGGMIMPTTMAMIFRMVPKTQVGSAMGILGIALMVAPARLAWTVNPGNAAAMGALSHASAMMGGGANGRGMALAFLQGMAAKTAFVNAIDDVFLITAIVTVVAVIPAFFLRKGKARGTAAAQ